MAEDEIAKRSKELQDLTCSNSALRCLLNLQSRRSELCKRVPGGQQVPEISERYERLIEAVKLLQHDLHLEREKSKRRRSRQFQADVARFMLFLFGSLAILTVFEPNNPIALSDYVCCQLYKLGYSCRW